MGTILLYFWLWFGTKVLGWEYVDMYTGKKRKNIIGITFSMSKKYIDKVSDIEMK